VPTPNSLYNQSLAYLDGKGVHQDHERSFALCSEAAAANHTDAVLAMGWHYLNGVGVEKDRDLAESWYRTSARQGEPRAMFSLGQMAYASRDYEEARAWLERALRRGHARSGCWLAKILWRTAETGPERGRAVALLQEAAAKNVQDAKRLVSTYERCRRAVP
jgi:uncharacterized protein